MQEWGVWVEQQWEERHQLLERVLIGTTSELLAKMILLLASFPSPFFHPQLQASVALSFLKSAKGLARGAIRLPSSRTPAAPERC